MKKKVLLFLVLALLGTMGLTGLAWAQGKVIQKLPPQPIQPSQPTTTPGNIVTRIVFVTSLSYTGNLGGLAGADQKCQQLANAAGLKGTFKAWLSDWRGHCPANRFNQDRGLATYRLVNNNIVARGWLDLTKGKIATPINVTETGAIVDDVDRASVWTNTKPDGGQLSANFPDVCEDWTNDSGVTPPTTQYGASGEARAMTGYIKHTNSYWTMYGYSNCAGKAHLYCFQQ